MNPPKSNGTRSGSRCAKAAATRAALVQFSLILALPGIPCIIDGEVFILDELGESAHRFQESIVRVVVVDLGDFADK
jgi:ATP-dependent DNA ligase